MEDALMEQFGNQIYQICFKEVIPKHDKVVGAKEQANMQECLARFNESYQIVAKSFLSYLASQRKKGDFGLPIQE